MKHQSIINPMYFHRLIHPMMRLNDSPEEVKRASDVLTWAGENLGRISRCCPGDEGKLLGIIYDYWFTKSTPPSLETLRTGVEHSPRNETLYKLLDAFESVRERLKPLTSLDMEQILDLRIKNIEDNDVNLVIEEMNQIIHGSYELNHQGKKATPDDKPMKGGRDAVSHFYTKIQEGTLQLNDRIIGGDLRSNLPGILSYYQRVSDLKKANRLAIKTGIGDVDRLIGGLKRTEFWGILGYAGQRKSAVARSIAYRAALSGHKVLYIPLESTFDTERNIVGVMHANSRSRGWAEGCFPITKRMIDNGELSEQMLNDLVQIVIPDFQQACTGSLVVRQPAKVTWADVKSIISMENQISPIDLVVVDYLTLVHLKGRDEVAEMTEVIKDAKHLCQTFNNNMGLTMLTPVQGNRAGYEHATKSDGRWDMAGVSKFSEFDKSLNGCFYTFIDPDGADDQQTIKFGICKSRDSKIIGPIPVDVNLKSGEIGGDPADDKYVSFHRGEDIDDFFRWLR